MLVTILNRELFLILTYSPNMDKDEIIDFTSYVRKNL